MSEKNYIIELSEGRCDDPKARIFKAALEEFGLRSLAGARTREIAAKANVNHAAISYYFGGKNELYMELARQIRDFIKYMNEPYFNRFADVLKSEDPFEARKLTLDFLRTKLSSKKVPDYILRSIILIITREELYQTQVFEIFIDVFRAELEMLAHLMSIASCGAIKGDKARIAAHMLVGQVHIFNCSRAGFQKVAGWDHLGPDKTGEVIEIIGEIFDELIKRNPTL